MSTRTLEGATSIPGLGGHRYDVFLSFRGEDTRWNFVGHLYHALSDAGISTFKDDMELQEGEEIKPEIIRAIRSSKISVVVLSRCYADSRWCLDELVEILRCRRMVGQLVIPVFYGVQTLDVLHQKGPLAEAFDKHRSRIDTEQVRIWREALKEVYYLRGLMWDEHG